MTQRQKWLLAAATIVAGGAWSLYLVAPQSLRRLQGKMANRVREQSRYLEENLRDVEATLSALEHQIQEAAHELSSRLEEIRQHALEQHLPGSDLASEDWGLTRSDVGQDLPRLPGR